MPESVGVGLVPGQDEALEVGASEASLKIGSTGVNLKVNSDTRVGQKPGSTGTRSDPGVRVCQEPGFLGANLVSEWVKSLFLWLSALHGCKPGFAGDF